MDSDRRDELQRLADGQLRLHREIHFDNVWTLIEAVPELIADNRAKDAEIERLRRELAGIGCSRFTCADDLSRANAEVARLKAALAEAERERDHWSGEYDDACEKYAQFQAERDAARRERDALRERVESLIDGAKPNPHMYYAGQLAENTWVVPVSHVRAVLAESAPEEGEDRG